MEVAHQSAKAVANVNPTPDNGISKVVLALSTPISQIKHYLPPIEGVPTLRGRIHPVALIAVVYYNIQLLKNTTHFTTSLKRSLHGFVLASILLFTSSSLLHLRYWTPRAYQLLKRVDHSNIFLLICFTFQPLSFASNTESSYLKTGSILVFIIAVIGVVFRCTARQPKKLVLALIYIIYGHLLVIFFPFLNLNKYQFLIVAASGLLYSIGGIVFGLRKPNLFLPHIGYQELSHILQVIAYFLMYVVIVDVVG
ncbi:hypothetical protein P9112_012700 [Eukaryota sp. TZLM1-RC]